jgi:hypothetical protein
MEMIRNNRIKIDQYIQYGFWELYQVFLIISIATTFCLFSVLTSESLGRRVPVFTQLLWQRQHFIVVDALDYK